MITLCAAVEKILQYGGYTFIADMKKNTAHIDLLVAAFRSKLSASFAEWALGRLGIDASTFAT
jgi:hypothetical protein